MIAPPREISSHQGRETFKRDMASQNLFPSIGTVAQQADDSADSIAVSDEDRTCPKENDDRVVQEVESLCMNCEEQVGTQLSSC